MAGNFLGGKHAAATNKKKFGKDFYKRIGAMGGKNGHTGGFAANKELAREAGRKGGLKSVKCYKMSKKEYELRQKMYYYRSRVKHFETRLKDANDKAVIKDCKEAKAHYKSLLKECLAKIKEVEKA